MLGIYITKTKAGGTGELKQILGQKIEIPGFSWRDSLLYPLFTRGPTVQGHLLKI